MTTNSGVSPQSHPNGGASLNSPSNGSNSYSSMSESRRVFWFTVSGWIGTALFYVVYEWIHSIGSNEAKRPITGLTLIDTVEWASIAWTTSYILSILWQHLLHRHLVFGSSSPYLSSLIWTYVSYTLSIVLSSILNHLLVAFLGIHHRVSFTLTLIITGVLNYHTLKNAFEAPNTATAAKKE